MDSKLVHEVFGYSIETTSANNKEGGIYQIGVGFGNKQIIVDAPLNDSFTFSIIQDDGGDDITLDDDADIEELAEFLEASARFIRYRLNKKNGKPIRRLNTEELFDYFMKQDQNENIQKSIQEDNSNDSNDNLKEEQKKHPKKSIQKVKSYEDIFDYFMKEKPRKENIYASHSELSETEKKD